MAVSYRKESWENFDKAISRAREHTDLLRTILYCFIEPLRNEDLYGHKLF